MNIFVLSADPQKSASMLCDKHVCKMAVESAQMLSTAICERLGVEAQNISGLYQPVCRHHPCNMWVGESIHNFEWLVEHGLAICKEFEKRFGHAHASSVILEHAAVYAPLFDLVPMTQFVQVMPQQYVVPDNPVAAYRNYYLADKRRFATWKNVDPPYWWRAGTG
jgi:hypothetical protein